MHDKNINVSAYPYFVILPILCRVVRALLVKTVLGSILTQQIDVCVYRSTEKCAEAKHFSHTLQQQLIITVWPPIIPASVVRRISFADWLARAPPGYYGNQADVIKTKHGKRARA